MRSVTGKIASLLACGVLVASSTEAIAAAPLPATQVPAVQSQAPSPWLMLSAMSSTRSIALAGTAAAQPNDAQPRPPANAAAPIINGEFIPVLVWYVLMVLALGTSGESGRPDSPP